jgi:hypothetical protein|nr:MAG TPA_asm: hypothetical protein [Caudoviricetes sp.]
MEKITMRKDYTTRVVPVEESVGHYLAKRAALTWTEDFIDEDTKETVTIDRCEVLLERGKMMSPELAAGLKKEGINEVEISNCPFRAEEKKYFSYLAHVKVIVRSSNNENAVLIVRSDSLRGAQDCAIDYAEGAVNKIFSSPNACYVYITKAEFIGKIHFIGRTNADIEEEEKRISEDPDAPVKEPFKVKANFINADVYNPDDRSQYGVHKNELFVVWAYDVVTAKNIVFDYFKHKFHTVYNDRETLRIVGATQFYAHTYVPAEYCNEYIQDEKKRLPVED